ncbi:Predicted acetyltransferase, GNAT family [Streptomyces sp. DvalAA-14]|uniref:GNAT family N-acetyltransferase n=1 Tax=unclassified Streptomyces TaxID=2593676 RepID=UPI00081B5DBB|nr:MULTISPECIES: GNAT family N-acetyltransferase [unclassified Streptomyces]MYS21428.1 GNAT family N-acetyltransferase [Streptomyces sp. SID4948]SCD92474.1 Predicted acetyltransferase, GNAT family [Streptomyces sp. DvalAA-14]
MRSNDWYLTEDVDDFLARAGPFLRSRPALHTMALTVTDTLRTRRPAAAGAGAPLFGRLERAGEVRAVFYRTPRGRLSPTPLTPGDADRLAVRLAALGHRFPGVSADHDTAAAFAEAWQRQTGATPTPRERLRLYRLGTLTPPEPRPAGRGRLVGAQDREHLMRWCRAFAADVGEAVAPDAASWAGTRFADKHYTFWQTPDGTAVSLAGTTPMVAGHIRVDPVYTPAHLRGRGYAGAVTVEVSRAALAAGATDVVLFANAGNPTSNALYQRIGYVPVADFAVHDFSGAADTPHRPPR